MTTSLGLSASVQFMATAARYGHPEGPSALYIECREPRLEAASLGILQGHPASIPPPVTRAEKLHAAKHLRECIERLRMLDRMGARCIPGFDYYQPALSKGQSSMKFIFGSVALPNSVMENGKQILKTKVSYAANI